MSGGDEVTYEYGLRIDCARNGCLTSHGDDGMVLPRSIESEQIQRVNGHMVTFVVRTVTRSPYRDLLPTAEPTNPDPQPTTEDA